ncbi:MAG: hypothetical protein AMJ90_04685 [candidate division Zixibacteria bacterium SM23_73_2]|nr:MAG: hypothetical protein AMJ90_04685 [candidate division Zixibacteria bacterium SM23_73_2]
MKRQFPAFVAFLSGFIMVFAFFVPQKGVVKFSQGLLTWVIIVGGFTLLLGIVNITRANLVAIKRKEKGWGYKVVLLTFLFAMAASAIIWGAQKDTPYDFLFHNIQKPMMSTMFSILAFFIASAAYRAFRARTMEATLLLLTSIVVMMGRTPLGQFIWKGLPSATDWLMAYPSMAVQRGILIGAALGAAAMSLRILLGIERTYMGRG